MNEAEKKAFNQALDELVELLSPRLGDDYSISYKLAIGHVLEDIEFIRKV